MTAMNLDPLLQNPFQEPFERRTNADAQGEALRDTELKAEVVLRPGTPYFPDIEFLAHLSTRHKAGGGAGANSIWESTLTNEPGSSSQTSTTNRRGPLKFLVITTITIMTQLTSFAFPLSIHSIKHIRREMIISN